MAEIDPKIAQDFLNVLNSMAEAIAGLKKPINEFNREFEETSSVARDLSTVLGRIVATSKDLPKGIKTTNDLMKKMLKDEKVFEQMKKKAFKLQEEELTKYWQKKISLARISAGLGWKEFKQTKQFKVLQEQMLMLKDKERKSLEDQFQKLKDQESVMKKLKDRAVDLKGMWEKVGDGIKHPTKLLDGAISKMSQWAGVGVKALGGLASLAGALFAVGTGLLVGGVMLAVGAFTALWSFLSSKVMPATADFNRQIGNMGRSTAGLKQQMVSAGQQFERLGMSFEEGASNVRDFADGMMLVGKPTREQLQKTIQTGLKLTQVVGLSAQQSGKLALFFEKSEGSLDGLNNTMAAASEVAHRYQVPVSQIRRDLGEDISLIARFGTRNRQVMLESAAKARTYGLSIKDINQAFGEQMDTFDKTSDVAAKLNSVFGTHINSYQLMLETNPVKRMEMLRKELLKQGKSWESLDVFQQNVIASSMGLSKEQAALGLASDEVRKKNEKAARQQAKDNKLNMDWDKGLQGAKRTLIAWMPLLDQLMQAFGRVFGIVLTGKDSGKSMEEFAKKVETGMNSLITTLNNFAKSPGGSLLSSLFGIGEEGGKPAKNIAQRSEDLGRDIGAWLRQLGQHGTASDTMRYGSARGAGGYANDALVTKTGEVIKFNPQDNIIATKAPVSRSAQGATAVAGKASSSGEQIINIMPAPIYLDGGKIAEIIFRASRR